MIPILRKQKQRNAAEKRRAKLNEISAAAHLVEQDISGALTHESLQPFFVVLLMKIPIKTCTMTAVQDAFDLKPDKWLPTNLPGGPWSPDDSLCTDSVVECAPASRHQADSSPKTNFVPQLFSHLYCHARRRRLLLPLSVAAKNRQALSVCLNPSSKKKQRGFRQLRALLLQFAQIVSLCRRLASTPSSHEEPDAENRVFKRSSCDSSLSWRL